MKIDPEQTQALVAKLAEQGWIKSANVGRFESDICFTEKGLARMDELADFIVAHQKSGGILTAESLVGMARIAGELHLRSDDEIHAFNGLLQSWVADKLRGQN